MDGKPAAELFPLEQECFHAEYEKYFKGERGIPILRVVPMTLIGCIVAAVAKGKEIVATVVLIVISSVIVGSNFCLHILDLPPQIAFPRTFLVPNFANWMGILTGGIRVRQIRSASLHQDATP